MMEIYINSIFFLKSFFEFFLSMWKLTLGYGTFLHRWMYVAPNITWHILGKLFPKKRKEKKTPPCYLFWCK